MMKTFQYCILLLIALTVSVDARIWTAKSGHTVTGEFEKFEKETQTVWIQLPDGNMAKVQLDLLSEEDQKFVASLIGEKSEKFGFNTPRDVLEQEAQKDNLEALYYLARCYAQGWNGCPKDEKKAGELFQRGSQSADAGNPFAQCCRATCYLKGMGVSKDDAEAVKWLREAAEQGNAAGQAGLGNCYVLGTGVPQDAEEAVKWLRLAAEQGEAEAQAALGACYLSGMSVSQNVMEAVTWLRKAAEQRFVPSQFMLGICYAEGAGVPKDMTEAVKWFHLAAEQGDVEAQFTLGECYSDGKGVEQDEAEAVKWYRKAAEQGKAEAQLILATCYLSGEGVPEDMEEAVTWYRKAAEQEFVPAQFMLGVCYLNGVGVPQDQAEAVKWLRKAAEQGFEKALELLQQIKDDPDLEQIRKAAEQGDAEAQFQLGECYRLGTGVAQDIEEAAKWYRKAAEQGHAVAQHSLGVFHLHGFGIAEDREKAVEWFRKAAEQGYEDSINVLKQMENPQEETELERIRKAAEQGDAEAQYKLGVCYKKGSGVSFSLSEAAEWFRKAAEQGLAEAQYELGVYYINYYVDGVAKYSEEAIQWFRKAAEQGHVVAQHNLGVYYEQGTGVAQDNAEAAKWYRKAAEQDHVGAQYALGICYDSGSGVPQDEAEAVKWYRKAAEQGFVRAQYNLGMFHAERIGALQDKEEAVKWLRMAADQGHEKAIEKLQEIEKGSSEDDNFVALTGHTDDVRSAAFSPDGKTIVTAGADATVRIWDTESGKELLKLEPGFTVGYASYLADGKRIVTVEDSETFSIVQVWDAVSGKELRKQERMGGFEVNLYVSDNQKKVVSSTYDIDDTVRDQVWVKVWDVDTGRLQILRSRGGVTNWGHSGWHAGDSTVVSPDGTKVVTIRGEVMGSCYIVVWNADSGRELRRLGASARPINGRQGATPGEAMAAVFSPNSSKIAIDFGDGVRIWDAPSGRELRKLAGGTGDFLPDGKRFASTDGEAILIWDINTGRKLATLPGAENVLFAPDSKKIVTQNEAGIVRVWDTDSGSATFGKELRTLNGFPAAFSSDGRKMAVVNESGDAWAIVDADSDTTLQEVEGQFFSFSKDGKRVMTTGDNNTVRVWTLP